MRTRDRKKNKIENNMGYCLISSMRCQFYLLFHLHSPSLSDASTVRFSVDSSLLYRLWSFWAHHESNTPPKNISVCLFVFISAKKKNRMNERTLLDAQAARTHLREFVNLACQCVCACKCATTTTTTTILLFEIVRLRCRLLRVRCRLCARN